MEILKTAIGAGIVAAPIQTQRTLRVSSVLNGAQETLDELVQCCTDPDVSNRLDSVADSKFQGWFTQESMNLLRWLPERLRLRLTFQFESTAAEGL
jgi:hypothetical protein